MGQKVHPVGFRLGVIRTWDSRWFSQKNYAALLHEDIKIRNIVTEGLLWRAEYRHDWSPYFIFQRGAFGATTKQDTFTVGFVAFFGPMR